MSEITVNLELLHISKNLERSVFPRNLRPEIAPMIRSEEHIQVSGVPVTRNIITGRMWSEEKTKISEIGKFIVVPSLFAISEIPYEQSTTNDIWKVASANVPSMMMAM